METELKNICQYRKETQTKTGLLIEVCNNTFNAVPMNTFKHNGLNYCGECLLKQLENERIKAGFPEEHIYA